jgi:hypothetical protein
MRASPGQLCVPPEQEEVVALVPKAYVHAFGYVADHLVDLAEA